MNDMMQQFMSSRFGHDGAVVNTITAQENNVETTYEERPPETLDWMVVDGRYWVQLYGFIETRPDWGNVTHHVYWPYFRKYFFGTDISEKNFMRWSKSRSTKYSEVMYVLPDAGINTDYIIAPYLQQRSAFVKFFHAHTGIPEKPIRPNETSKTVKAKANAKKATQPRRKSERCVQRKKEEENMRRQKEQEALREEALQKQKEEEENLRRQKDERKKSDTVHEGRPKRSSDSGDDRSPKRTRQSESMDEYIEFASKMQAKFVAHAWSHYQEIQNNAKK